MSVYTVGHEKVYDREAILQGDKFEKLGKTDIYPGGFACETPEDARRLITEFEKQGKWAVYELEADWDKDTEPSENGWWHALINDARILRKVEPCT